MVSEGLDSSSWLFHFLSVVEHATSHFWHQMAHPYNERKDTCLTHLKWFFKKQKGNSCKILCKLWNMKAYYKYRHYYPEVIGFEIWSIVMGSLGCSFASRKPQIKNNIIRQLAFSSYIYNIHFFATTYSAARNFLLHVFWYIHIYDRFIYIEVILLFIGYKKFSFLLMFPNTLQWVAKNLCCFPHRIRILVI